MNKNILTNVYILKRKRIHTVSEEKGRVFFQTQILS